MPEFTLPGGRTLAVQTFPRMSGARSWVTLGPVYDEDDRKVGIAATLRTLGVAAYTVPRTWERSQCCDGAHVAPQARVDRFDAFDC